MGCIENVPKLFGFLCDECVGVGQDLQFGELVTRALYLINGKLTQRMGRELRHAFYETSRNNSVEMALKIINMFVEEQRHDRPEGRKEVQRVGEILHSWKHFYELPKDVRIAADTACAALGIGRLARVFRQLFHRCYPQTQSSLQVLSWYLDWEKDFSLRLHSKTPWSTVDNRKYLCALEMYQKIDDAEGSKQVKRLLERVTAARQRLYKPKGI